MTDEEKAEEYVSPKTWGDTYYVNCCGDWSNEEMKKAYLDGLAEGRKEIEQWKQEWENAQIKANEEGYARTTLQIKYKELQKENKEILEDNDNLNKWIDELKAENEELKAQIEILTRAYTLTVDKSVIREQELEAENEALKQSVEEGGEIIAELKAHCKAVDEVNEKMKCCENCKYGNQSYYFEPCNKCGGCDKWEPEA